MAKTVTSIPAKVNPHTHVAPEKKRRVAGYARVSTDLEEQQTSYQAQVNYYTNYIKSREDWIFVDVYTDEGISALNTRRREGFNRMVADALAGKIDLIITKSVSRFARNTVDSLTTIRQLKEQGVEVYFEKENIWTFDSKGEVLLTIMSSLAQEESRSISENCTWGQRKRMADGKVTVAFTHFLGYDQGENGEFVINEEQAEIVRLIYRLFLEGKSTYRIAQILTESEYKTMHGKDTWQKSTVINVLKNEKYKGDALLQKTYTSDFLTKRHKKNNGEVQQFYVSENHEAIIPPDIWDLVQEEFVRRSRNKKGCGCFSNMVRCGVCGEFYCKKMWHSTDKYKRVVWQCKTKAKCKTPHLSEDDIRQAFITAFNSLLAKRNEMLAAYEEIRDLLFNEEEWAEKTQKAYERFQQKAAALQDFCDTPAADDFDSVYEELNKEVEEAQEEYKKVVADCSAARYHFHETNHFYNKLRRQQGLLTEFDELLWYALVDYVKVISKDNIIIVFKDGTEI